MDIPVMLDFTVNSGSHMVKLLKFVNDQVEGCGFGILHQKTEQLSKSVNLAQQGYTKFVRYFLSKILAKETFCLARDKKIKRGLRGRGLQQELGFADTPPSGNYRQLRMRQRLLTYRR